MHPASEVTLTPSVPRGAHSIEVVAASLLA